MDSLQVCRARRRLGRARATPLGRYGSRFAGVGWNCGRRASNGNLGSHHTQRDSGTERRKTRFPRIASDDPARGRPAREAEQPELMAALERLVEPASRGDPMSPLRWTCKSTRTLADELKRQGFQVSHTKVGELLKRKGLQLASQSQDAGRQTTSRSERAIRAHQPSREGLPASGTACRFGRYEEEGSAGKPQKRGPNVSSEGQAAGGRYARFPRRQAGQGDSLRRLRSGRATKRGFRWESTTTRPSSRWLRSHSGGNGWAASDTAAAKRLLITGDSGGSNGHRNRLWKAELQRFADRTGMIVEVCHFPPGTSKWNKIEHRLFCHITRNWQGVPLETHEIVVNLIGSTRTTEGLEVHAWLDEREYPKGPQSKRCGT